MKVKLENLQRKKRKTDSMEKFSRASDNKFFSFFFQFQCITKNLLIYLFIYFNICNRRIGDEIEQLPYNPGYQCAFACVHD